MAKPTRLKPVDRRHHRSTDVSARSGPTGKVGEPPQTAAHRSITPVLILSDDNGSSRRKIEPGEGFFPHGRLDQEAGEAMMSAASQDNDPCANELTDEQVRLRRKTLGLISEFGERLLETPLPELRRMANLACGDDPGENLFAEIWDRYRFVPTSALLRTLGGEPIAGLSPFMRRLDEVWEQSPDADEAPAPEKDRRE